jgi:hypothetical protein
MKEFLVPHVIISLAVMIGSLSTVAITLILVLRNKISGVHVSRTGVEIRTHDSPTWSQTVDKIEQIDRGTCKAIRKATTGLMILDPEKYGMSPEAILIIREANQPLIYAAYENHHTRELDVDADVYLADKTYDILAAVRIWKKHFPELTEEHCEAHAYYWFKKILIPILRRACVEKVVYYHSQIEQSDVSYAVKAILTRCCKKNEEYIKCIDRLAARPDITEKSSIFYPLPTKGEI